MNYITLQQTISDNGKTFLQIQHARNLDSQNIPTSPTCTKLRQPKHPYKSSCTKLGAKTSRFATSSILLRERFSALVRGCFLAIVSTKLRGRVVAELLSPDLWKIPKNDPSESEDEVAMGFRFSGTGAPCSLSPRSLAGVSEVFADGDAMIDVVLYSTWNNPGGCERNIFDDRLQQPVVLDFFTLLYNVVPSLRGRPAHFPRKTCRRKAQYSRCHLL